MTNTVLKAQIDSQITNETTPNGITPTEVGENIKAVVDYVDQEAEKILHLTLSSSEILALNTSPKVLFPAEAGKIFLVNLIYYKYNHVTTPYNTGGNFRLAYGSGNSFLITFADILTSVENTFAYSTPFYSSAKQSSYENTNVLLTTATSNPSAGDGTLDLYFSYKEILV
jgi:hypothetical protein